MDENKLKIALVERLEGCIEFISNLASDTHRTLLKIVLEIPFEELPLYISDTVELKREMVLARLRKEDIKKNPEFVLQSLWDIEFDFDDYKGIGFNDGELETLKMVFNELEDEAHAKECGAWVYSD
jgi:hypothetical protein